MKLKIKRASKVFYDESSAFEEQLSSLYYLDLSITYRINKMKYSGRWALQVKIVLRSFSHEGCLETFKTGDILELNPTGIVPSKRDKIEF